MSEKASLDSLERLGWRFGLRTVRDLLSQLGGPQKGLRCVHVAGSNGKGSTSAFMASMLRSAGRRTGLYTSPHLSDVRERFRVDGRWIPERDFARCSRKVLSACEKVRAGTGHLPTQFEALTALAFLWFKEQKVDLAVVEVGLGGRLDATNAIDPPEAVLITPVSLEHQDILGKTVRAIALEKAGILKEGAPAATVQTDPGALRAVEDAARRTGSRLWVAGKDFRYRADEKGFHWEGPGLSRSFRLSEPFPYRVSNASLAVAGYQLLRERGFAGNDRAVQEGLTAMRWPGRTEVIRGRPLVLLDGAHNPGAAAALADHLKRGYPGKRWIVLNGFLEDKDFDGAVKALVPAAAFSIVTEPPSGRSRDGAAVFRAWERSGVRGLWVRDWRQALSTALRRSDLSGGLPVLITGSLYLVGACREVLAGKRGLAKI